MNKRLLLLFGYAITAVIINHAIYWSANSSQVWIEPLALRFTLGTGFPVNEMFYHLILAAKKLMTFCVPAFLFASGYFAAYSGRKKGSAQAKVIFRRVLALFVPYAIWSVVLFILNPYDQQVSLGKMAARLLYGGAVPEYYFVPLLIQFTILAPFLVSQAREHPRRLLLLAGLLQLSVVVVSYASLFVRIPLAHQFVVTNRIWSLFPTWAFFFPLGMVAGFHATQFYQLITRYRPWLLVGMVTFGSLAVLETEIVASALNGNLRDSALTIPTTLYALCTTFVFLAYDFTRSPISKPFYFLADKTYSIYLIHPVVFFLIMRFVKYYLHQILSFPYLFLMLMIAIGLCVPALVLVGSRRAMGANVYRYLFG